MDSKQLIVTSPARKRKVDVTDVDKKGDECDKTWLTFGRTELTVADRNITSGGLLQISIWILLKLCSNTNIVISLDFFQLYSYLVTQLRFITIQPALQIVHSRGNHWIVVTTLQCPDKTVKVHAFDSLYTSTDPSTSQLLCKLYGADVKIQAEKCPKQLGVKDCGLFAIAIATVLARGGNPSQVRLKQDAMRGHLINCFEKFELAPFPTN